MPLGELVGNKGLGPGPWSREGLGLNGWFADIGAGRCCSFSPVVGGPTKIHDIIDSNIIFTSGKTSFKMRNG
jgi:hypothetical protein